MQEKLIIYIEGFRFYKKQPLKKENKKKGFFVKNDGKSLLKKKTLIKKNLQYLKN
jgi:hypothetical protein